MESYSAEVMELGDAIYALRGPKAGELQMYLEQRYNIKAPNAGYVAPPPQEEAPKEKPPEQTEFTVIISEFEASKKIGIVKEVRVITGLGLKESMAMVGSLPATIKEGVSKAEAEKAKAMLEAAGAVVVIK